MARDLASYEDEDPSLAFDPADPEGHLYHVYIDFNKAFNSVP